MINGIKTIFLQLHAVFCFPDLTIVLSTGSRQYFYSFMPYFAFFNAKFLPNRQVSSIQAGWIVQLREARIWLSDVQAAEDTVSMFVRGRLGLGCPHCSPLKHVLRRGRTAKARTTRLETARYAIGRPIESYSWRTTVRTLNGL